MNVPTQLMPPNTTIQPHYVMKNNIFILVKLASVTFVAIWVRMTLSAK